MKEAPDTKIPFTFSKWQVFIPIIIGLGISFYLLFNALRAKTYIATAEGKGQYAWVDANSNGKVDFTLQSEFVRSETGNYAKETFVSTFTAIDWNLKIALGILLAFLFMVGRDFFYMLRIRFLTKNQLGFKQSFYVIMLWEFASALSPGIVGGAAVAMFILKKEGIAFGRSTAIVIVTAFLDNLFYLLLIPLAFLIVPSALLFPSDSGVFTQSTEVVFWIGLTVIALVCLFLYLSLFRHPLLIFKALKALFSLPFLRKWKVKAEETGNDVALASRVLKEEPFSFWLKAFGFTFGSWICRYLVINALLAAFLNLSLFNHFLILGKQLVLWLFLLISPTPGASGIAEYAFSELLSGFTSSGVLLVFLALLWRLISYFPYLFIGSFLFPRWLRRSN